MSFPVPRPCILLAVGLVWTTGSVLAQEHSPTRRSASDHGLAVDAGFAKLQQAGRAALLCLDAARLETARGFVLAGRYGASRALLRELAVTYTTADGTPRNHLGRATLQELERLAARVPPEFLSAEDHDHLAAAAFHRGDDREAIRRSRIALRRFDETGLDAYTSIDTQERRLVARYERLTRAYFALGDSRIQLAAECARFSIWAFRPEPSPWDLDTASQRQASRARSFALAARRVDPLHASMYERWLDEARFLWRVHDRSLPASSEPFILGRRLRARGRAAEARRALESIRDPRDLYRFRARVLLGRWAFEDGREAEAAAILDAALEELATCQRNVPGFRSPAEATYRREAHALLETIRK